MTLQAGNKIFHLVARTHGSQGDPTGCLMSAERYFYRRTQLNKDEQLPSTS